MLHNEASGDPLRAIVVHAEMQKKVQIAVKLKKTMRFPELARYVL